MLLVLVLLLLYTAMTTTHLPSVLDVPALSTAERAAILDMLFEPSIPLHTLSVASLRENKFMSYDDLVASIGVQLIDLAESKSTSDTEWLDKILRAHPRLGDKTIHSPQSRAEQAQLKSSDGKDEEGYRLGQLNDEYEKIFPGLKYVFVTLSRFT